MSAIPETLINHILSFRPTHPVAVGLKQMIDYIKEEYEFELEICGGRMEIIGAILEKYEDNEEALYDYIYPDTGLDIPDSIDYYAAKINDLNYKLTNNIIEFFQEEEKKKDYSYLNEYESDDEN
jgi:hypothetical protein